MNPAALPPPESGYELNGPPEDFSPPAPKLNVRKLLFALRKYWWVPVLTLLLALGGTVGYVRTIKPTFTSKAMIWQAVKMQLPGSEMFSQDDQEDLSTQTQVFRSDRLRNMALARLKTVMTNALPLGKDGTPLEVDLTLGGGRGSAVITVQASCSDPVYTRAYLDSILNVYLEFRRNVRKEVSGDTLASISEQVLRLEKELKANQEILLDYEKTNNMAILQEEASGAGSYLVKLQTQLADYKLEAQLLDAKAYELDRGGVANTNAPGSPVAASGGPGSASPPDKGGDSTVTQQLELWKLERAKLSQNLRPSHPKIVKLDQDIERAEKINELYRTQNLAQNHEQIATTRQSLNMKADSVKETIKEWEARVIQANARVAEADRLKMNVARSQSLYDRFVNLLQNVDISRNIDQATLSILEPASAAKRTYTREISLLGMSVMGGLAVGLGIVFLIGFRDDRFTSVVEVNATLGDSVVGMLPDMPKEDEVTLPLLKLNDPRFMYAESYRSLRSALLFQPMAGERPKVVLITSAVPSEGKSTISLNLARTLASGGSRVLLVDADLRKGQLHKILGLQRSPGLVELLQQPADLDRFIQTDSLPNFAFLSRGHAVGQTSDFFLRPEFEQLLARLRQQYDHVIIDTSPVFATDDPGTLAPKVDGVLFVVRGNYSGARQVREALDLLQQRQARILGVVFNRVEASTRSYYYYKYKDYHESDDESEEDVADIVK